MVMIYSPIAIIVNILSMELLGNKELGIFHAFCLEQL